MRIRAVLAALPLVALAACGTTTSSPVSNPSGSGGSIDSAVSGSDGSLPSASASPGPTLGPVVPPASTVAAPVPAGQLAAASGGFGIKPALSFPSKNPPATLQRRILVQGKGAKVTKGDYLVSNYLGQIWGGKVFDNSYDKKATATFKIGAGKVVPGWDTALVGTNVGDRVELSLPPADGYGASGNEQAGIKGTDTLVFVIDVVGVISSASTGQANAAPQKLPADVPQVTGAPGQEPKIVIAPTLKEPTKNAAYLVAKGTGAKVAAGTLLVQLVVTDWKKTQTQSTWPAAAGASSSAAAGADPSQPGASQDSKGVQEIQVSADSPIAGLIGMPMGSRALVLIAPSKDPQSGQTQPSAVAVVDLVAQG